MDLQEVYSHKMNHLSNSVNLFLEKMWKFLHK